MVTLHPAAAANLARVVRWMSPQRRACETVIGEASARRARAVWVKDARVIASESSAPTARSNASTSAISGIIAYPTRHVHRI
jgi:hypothetical protein